jgi:hypothetical protein
MPDAAAVRRRPWARLLVLAGILGIGAALGVLLLRGGAKAPATPAWRVNWNKVTIGMKKDEVVRLLGEPAEIEEGPASKYDNWSAHDAACRMIWHPSGRATCWCYFSESGNLLERYRYPSDEQLERDQSAARLMEGDSWWDQVWSFLGY